MVGSNFVLGFDNDYNLLVYFFFLVFLVGVTFLMFRGVLAGTIYTIMIFAGLISYFFSLQFVKGESGVRSLLNRYVRLPFSQGLGVSIVFFLFGFFAPVLIQFVGGFFRQGFSIAAFSVPLFGNQLSTQSFSAAEIGSNPSWNFFITSFSAGVGESLVFNWSLVIAGILFSLLLVRLVSKRGFVPSRFVVVFLSLLFVGLLFVGAHVLNGTYSGLAFLWAFLFIMVANFSIYFGGVFLVFWIGYHISNNQLWLIQNMGWSVFVRDVLFGWYGLFLLVFFVLLFYYLLNNWSFVRKELGKLKLFS